jgi:hypothetical protein
MKQKGPGIAPDPFSCRNLPAVYGNEYTVFRAFSATLCGSGA